MPLMKSIFSIMSPAGARGRLSILIFHRVAAQPDPIFPDEMHARRFDEVCGWLKSWFNVLPLDAAVAHLKAGTLSARAACITFDDGYADNHDVALPILMHHGLSATFFIATSFLDGGQMWNDSVIESVRHATANTLDLGELGRFDRSTPVAQAAAINAIISKVKYLSIADRMAATQRIAGAARIEPSNNLMMTSDQVKAMRRAGMQIGAHTLSHPILARLGDDEARAEIVGSKVFLEYLLGERISLFAYPNGKPGQDYLPQHVSMVQQASFDAAVSTAPGVSSRASDYFQLPRFTPWDQSQFRFGARLLSNLRHVSIRGT
jgi:peptidoglycan/xylan/chitin deacetylase (PgdA/CDA1 family)